MGYSPRGHKEWDPAEPPSPHDNDGGRNQLEEARNTTGSFTHSPLSQQWRKSCQLLLWISGADKGIIAELFSLFLLF